MSYKLYLDDIRNPKAGNWVIARKFDEFIEIIQTLGIPDEISFDHDLGWDEHNNCELKNGYDCAKWLVENDIEINKFNIHSANPVGSQNIYYLLKNFIAFKNRERKQNRFSSFSYCSHNYPSNKSIFFKNKVIY